MQHATSSQHNEQSRYCHTSLAFLTVDGTMHNHAGRDDGCMLLSPDGNPINGCTVNAKSFKARSLPSRGLIAPLASGVILIGLGCQAIRQCYQGSCLNPLMVHALETWVHHISHHIHPYTEKSFNAYSIILLAW